MRELFDLANVGPPLEQFGGKAGGNFWQSLLEYCRLTRNRAGVAAQEDADLIFFDDHPALETGDRGGGGREGGFGSGSFEFGNDAAFEALAENPQGFPKGIGGA